MTLTDSFAPDIFSLATTDAIFAICFCEPDTLITLGFTDLLDIPVSIQNENEVEEKNKMFEIESGEKVSIMVRGTTLRINSPPFAMETFPVSSDTIMVKLSVASLIPTPALCLVPL